jgi:hypothetical protein
MQLGAQSAPSCRYHWARLSRGWHGQLQALTFVDAEHVGVNKNVWTSAKHDATLRGTGVELSWTGAKAWSAKTYIAARLGAALALVGSASLVRAWFEISKGF